MAEELDQSTIFLLTKKQGNHFNTFPVQGYY